MSARVLYFPVRKPEARAKYGKTLMLLSVAIWASSGFVRLAVNQVVVRLQGDRRGVTVLFGDSQPLPDAIGAVVGDSEIANLAGDDQRVEGFECFFERSLRVVEMRVVQIDAVRLQALQRRLSCGRDVVGLQSLEIGMATHLGGDHDVVLQSPIGDPFPDDRFGFPTGIAGSRRRVRVGGVDEVCTGFGERVEDLEGRLLVRGPSERVAAQAESEDVEVRISDDRHCVELPSMKVVAASRTVPSHGAGDGAPSPGRRKMYRIVIAAVGVGYGLKY